MTTTTTAGSLAELDRLLGANRARLDQLAEQRYQRGDMTLDEAVAWRLSPERWEAIEAGVIEADERDEPAPVVSLCDRRASRGRGGA